MGIATGAIVGLGGGMFELAAKAAEAGNRIYEASEQTGISAQAMSGIAAIAKETGGNFEGLATAFARAEVNLSRIRDGSSEARQDFLRLMGGSKQLADLGLKPTVEQLHTMLQRIFALHDPTERARLLSDLFGRSWMDNVTALKAFAASADGGAEAAKKLGLNMDAERAHAYTVQMDTLKGEMAGLALTLGSKLIPVISDTVAGLSAWGTVIPLLGTDIKDLGKIVFDVATKDFGGMVLAIDDIKKRKGEIQSALAAAGQAAKDAAEALAGGKGDDEKGAAGAVKRVGVAAEYTYPKLKTTADVLRQLASENWDNLVKILAGDFKAPTLTGAAWDRMSIRSDRWRNR